MYVFLVPSSECIKVVIYPAERRRKKKNITPVRMSELLIVSRGCSHRPDLISCFHRHYYSATTRSVWLKNVLYAYGHYHFLLYLYWFLSLRLDCQLEVKETVKLGSGQSEWTVVCNIFNIIHPRITHFWLQVKHWLSSHWYLKSQVLRWNVFQSLLELVAKNHGRPDFENLWLKGPVIWWVALKTSDFDNQCLWKRKTLRTSDFKISDFQNK